MTARYIVYTDEWAPAFAELRSYLAARLDSETFTPGHLPSFVEGFIKNGLQGSNATWDELGKWCEANVSDWSETIASAAESNASIEELIDNLVTKLRTVRGANEALLKAQQAKMSREA